MLESIKKARQETYEKRRMIAAVGAGLIIAIIFVVWISTFPSRLKTEQVVGVDVDEYKPTMIESIKRKTTLLLGDLEIPQIGSPVEYIRLSEDTKDLASSTESELTLEEKTGISTTTNDESFEDIIEELLEEKKDIIEVE